MYEIIVFNTSQDVPENSFFERHSTEERNIRFMERQCCYWKNSIPYRLPYLKLMSGASLCSLSLEDRAEAMASLSPTR